MASNTKNHILKEYTPAIVSVVFLLFGIYLEFISDVIFDELYLIIIYAIAYLPVGFPVVWRSLKLITRLDIFNEFFLMSIATIGAISIGEYAEGVAVMLFYSVGELFQGAAVRQARRSIEALLKLQVEEVTLIEDGERRIVHPENVKVGQIIQIKPGEKIALDGKLLTENASFNTAALTGESVPSDKQNGDIVLAGMVNLNEVCELEVTSEYHDTKLSKILKLVQDAAGRKAPTQRFISKFAKVYTPIVVALATLLTFVPYLIVEDYLFTDWLYRALIFLVISCPCALVISIPLGYFGGLGAASRSGILVKGSNYLDLLVKVDTVVMDKTGTLTKGVFEVEEVSTALSKETFLSHVVELEKFSSHPIAQAIVKYGEKEQSQITTSNIEEIPGHGLKGQIGQHEVIAGNYKILDKFKVTFDEQLKSIVNTTVFVAFDGQYAGYITIADTIKEDADAAIRALRAEGIQNIIMLSGDKQSVVDEVAKKLNIDTAKGDLLPEDKVNEVELLKQQDKTTIFVGDGINDAPVIALSDVGMAMGGLGSDAAIETADVIIQTDHPSKISTAIRIGKATKRIVWQNIFLAFGVKFLVLILGAGGMATMWEAVFADVGVALLAILNAIRIQRMKF
ncbi:heavy metal translocating P-type ATPase [bacterium]|jgi:Cd2+/Zn2+-exporting ATPase|nr:heavy metal translocating P-type ATPase [bacterium]